MEPQSLPTGTEAPPAAADVVVIGAGVVGLVVAYFLRRHGREVVVLEKGDPGQATSWGNCGLITPSYADPMTQPASLIMAAASLFDPQAPIRFAPTTVLRRWPWFLGFARRCRDGYRERARRIRFQLLERSRQLIEELIARERLDCEWCPGGLTTIFRSAAAMTRHVELHRRLGELGLTFEELSGDEVRKREPLISDEVIGAIHSPGDAHLNPGRFLQQLADALGRMGVAICSRTEVSGLKGGRRLQQVTTDRGTLHCREVVVAAGPWTPQLARGLGLHVPIEPVKGYSITWSSPLEGLRGPLKLWESKVVATPWPSGFRLGSTMEFTGYDSRLDPERLGRLLAGARLYLDHPLELGEGRPWYGWRPMSVDELPIVGPSSRVANLHFACGHGQLGLSQAAASGELAADLLTQRAPKLDPTPFAPRRFGI